MSRAVVASNPAARARLVLGGDGVLQPGDVAGGLGDAGQEGVGADVQSRAAAALAADMAAVRASSTRGVLGDWGWGSGQGGPDLGPGRVVQGLDSDGPAGAPVRVVGTGLLAMPARVDRVIAASGPAMEVAAARRADSAAEQVGGVAVRGSGGVAFPGHPGGVLGVGEDRWDRDP
jgi:hypothetical protein